MSSILVVDDDAGAVKALADVLRGKGHAVHTAALGREALALLTDVAVDVAIVATTLSDLSGLALVAAIKDVSPHTEVIFATGEAPGVAGGDVGGSRLREVRELLRALRGSEARYRLIIEQIHDAIFITDLDGSFTFGNARLEALTGYTVAELIGRSIFTLLAPESAAGAEVRKAAVRTGHDAPFSYETRIVRKDGAYRWVEVNTTSVVEDGRVIARLGAARDITPRKDAERQRGEANAMLEALLQSAPAATIALDLEGRVLRWNRTAERLFGWTEAEVLGQPLPIIPSDILEEWQTTRAQWVQGQVTIAVDRVRRRKDGRLVRVSGSGGPLRDATGRVVGTVANLIDLSDRERAEAALRESDERFRAVFEQAAVGIGVTGPDGRWLRVNQRLAEMLGYTPGELGTLRFHDITHPDDLAVNVARHGELLRRERSSYSLEKRYIHKSGAIVWTDVTVSVVVDARGEPQYSIAVVQDMTTRAEALAARRAAEEALRESEERTRLIVEHALDAVITIDADGRILSWNPQAERLFGWSAEESVGRPLVDLIVPPAYRAAHVAGLARFHATGDGPVLGRRIELSALRRDGGEFPIELAITPMRLGGSVVFSAFLRDITERKHSETALRESEERFRAAFEQATVGITVVATDGRFLRVNQRFCDMLGYGADELAGMRFQDITHPDDLAENLARREPMIANAAPAYTMEKRYVRKDGAIVWVQVSAAQARDAAGVAGYSIGIVQDVTERKQLEHELQHAQRMEGVGQLAGGIAHDFNNMLTVISGRSQFGLERLDAADPLRRDLELIHKTAERAAGLTRQLLAFSRKQVLQPKVMALNDLVASSTNLLKRLLGEDIELTFLPAPDAGRVRVDPGQLEQVVMNLAVNARDAMRAGGALTIETANVELDAAYAARHVDVKPGPYVMLSVRDTGSGMAPEVQARIFEPFFTTKGPGRGTGLGLAMVYGIVKQSGGHLRVKSAVGAGTSFDVLLPRTDDAISAPTRVPAGALPRGRETILLVEDEPEVRSLTHELLARLGYVVLDAAAPADALLIAQRHVGIIDLLLTDVVMPRMSGRALAELVAAERPETRILFMSGYTDDAIARHGVLEPDTELLEKPFTARALAEKVRALLDRRK